VTSATMHNIANQVSHTTQKHIHKRPMNLRHWLFKWFTYSTTCPSTCADCLTQSAVYIQSATLHCKLTAHYLAIFYQASRGHFSQFSHISDNERY